MIKMMIKDTIKGWKMTIETNIHFVGVIAAKIS